MLENLIAEIGRSVDGQLIDRIRVVDHLLDIRLAGSDRADVVMAVDRYLANIPGKNVVDTRWWSDALADLSAKVEFATA